MTVRMMQIPAVIEWDSWPGFVDADTKIVYRIWVRGVQIDCETEADAIELVRHCQQEYDCEAKRFAAAVEKRIKQAEQPEKVR